MLDLLVRNVRVVRPNRSGTQTADIAIRDGRLARVGPQIPVAEAKEIVDGRNRLAFPDCVDAHMHIGIYQPHEGDAAAESKVNGKVIDPATGKYIRRPQK